MRFFWVVVVVVINVCANYGEQGAEHFQLCLHDAILPLLSFNDSKHAHWLVHTNT